MKITRRFFLSVLFSLLLIHPALPQTPPNQKFLVFVGTYTDKTDSKGIYAFEFDPSSGKLTPRGLAAETANPSWVVVHPNGKWAYAANESGKQSTISAFSINPQSAKLTLLNKLPAEGEDPCHLAFDKSGKYLFVANYTSGNVVVFPILSDGKLGEYTANAKDKYALGLEHFHGLNKERQEAPHAHWVAASEHNRFVYVADLGLDTVLVYTFDGTKGALTTADGAVAKPATGPRHVAWSNDGKFMYVLGELASTVTVFANDTETFKSQQVIAMLPSGFSGRNDAAEIALHPSGKWLFASNRGHDSIAVFSVDPANGTLTFLGNTPTGGKEPRHFALDPTGQFLLAENQNSNSIVVFRINLATGALTEVSLTGDISSPVCLVFLQP